MNKKTFSQEKEEQNQAEDQKKHESHANKQKSSKNKILQRVPK